MKKKNISLFLKQFEELTGVKAEDNKRYILNSSFGLINIHFRLDKDMIFTRLENPKMKYDSFGFNPYSGKRNYFGFDSLYHFLFSEIVTGDIRKQKKFVAWYKFISPFYVELIYPIHSNFCRFRFLKESEKSKLCFLKNTNL